MTRTPRNPSVTRLLITPGEPAGIGPDLTLQLAQRAWPAQLIAVADPQLLRERARQLKLKITIDEIQLDAPRRRHRRGHLPVLPVATRAPVRAGTLNPANAHYVLQTLDLATRACLDRHADGLVTGPVQKSVINDAGIAFSGHTEYLAKRCKTATPVMLLTGGGLRVALATTHLALAQVPRAITRTRLAAVLQVLHRDLQTRFGIRRPRIVVAGLNPHSGEGGHLGREEIEIITPTLEALRKEGLHLTGPLPADTLFTPQHLKHADAVLAMFHDQGLPVLKHASFGDAVNVTLGLPIVRTSVDHGTALDLAGRGRADGGSFEAAVKLAIELAAR